MNIYTHIQLYCTYVWHTLVHSQIDSQVTVTRLIFETQLANPDRTMEAIFHLNLVKGVVFSWTLIFYPLNTLR